MLHVRSFRIDSGATLVESALVCVFLFLMVGAIIELGVVLYEYSALTAFIADTSHTFSRLTNTSCEGVVEGLKAAAPRFAKQVGLSERVDVSDTVACQPLNPADPPLLKVSASVEVGCLFCNVFGRPLTLRSSTQAILESVTTCASTC